jgi:N-acetylneuraminic acid mutarotase
MSGSDQSAVNPPSLRVAHGAAAIGEEIYLFGGRNAEKVELGDFWKWNIRSHEWTKLSPAFSGPTGRSYHGTVAVQDKLYVFGGCSAAGRQNDLWCYDPETNTWIEMPSAGAPSARGGPAVVATESEIYVFYGFNGTELSDIFAFDVNAGAWREVTTTGDIPSPRSVHAAAYLGNRQVFLWGGEGSPSGLGHEGAGKHFGDGFILNLDTTVWAKIPAEEGAPNPRGWLAATSFPGGAAIFGGLADDNTRQADLYLFRQ